MNKKKMLASYIAPTYEIDGYTLKTNQLIPDNVVTITETVDTSILYLPVADGKVSRNYIGTWKANLPPITEGHKVYARIITDNPLIRVSWWKGYDGNYDNAWDFVTGEELTGNSTPSSMMEGIYAFDSKYTWATDNTIKIYTYFFKDLPLGTYRITIQLVDLTDVYGEGSEPTNLVTLKAQHPELKLVNPYGYRLIGGGECRYNQLSNQALACYNSDYGDTIYDGDITRIVCTRLMEGSSAYRFGIANRGYFCSKNHAYFISTTFRTNLRGRARHIVGDTDGTYYNQSYDVDSGDWHIARTIFKATADSQYTNRYISFSFFYGPIDVGDYIDAKDRIVVDLTDIFGFGNEPTTIDELRAKRPDLLEYQDYATLNSIKHQLITSENTIIPLNEPLFYGDNIQYKETRLKSGLSFRDGYKTLESREGKGYIFPTNKN